MLFSSFIFIGFLLCCLAAQGAVSRFSLRARLAVITASSLVFYMSWRPEDALILLGSVCVNFLLSLAVRSRREQGRLFAGLGIAVNIGLLLYYKYLYFFITDVLTLAPASLGPLQSAVPPPDMLPLGISFYTFTQIAFLVDCLRGGTHTRSGLEYFFVLIFFPHSIAGPIALHRQITPQLHADAGAPPLALRSSGLYIGLTLFSLGLFKKVVLADQLAVYADAVFDHLPAGGRLHAADALIGQFAYTFQLYFDFSGYSDMALGLSRLCNIVLPANFYSPYKAENIQDFWRRWHITLSNFLRDYLYIPLGGGRRGPGRTYVNLCIVFLLCGMWHGAGWTFILWGGLHGAYVVAHRLYARSAPQLKRRLERAPGYRLWCVALTFLAVSFAWVLFRSPDLAGFGVYAHSLLAWTTDPAPLVADPALAVGLLAAGGLLCWCFPNSLEIFARHNVAIETPAVRRDAAATPHATGAVRLLRPDAPWSPVVYALLFLVSAVVMLTRSSDPIFLYFQF